MSQLYMTLNAVASSSPAVCQSLIQDGFNIIHFLALSLVRLRQTQLPVKCITIRFTSKEVLQGLHLILASTLLEHHVSISAPLLAVHGVLLEDRIEHIRAVHLRGEIAVVARIVATKEMTKGCLAVTYS